jgi:hypothetical protein
VNGYVPSRWRKKPVVIEAFRYDGTALCRELLYSWSRGLVDFDGDVFVHTLEGRMVASRGDWVIRGVHGEFYPCKPEIFEATYEPVTEEA